MKNGVKKNRRFYLIHPHFFSCVIFLAGAVRGHKNKKFTHPVSQISRIIFHRISHVESPRCRCVCRCKARTPKIVNKEKRACTFGLHGMACTLHKRCLLTSASGLHSQCIYARYYKGDTALHFRADYFTHCRPCVFDQR